MRNKTYGMLSGTNTFMTLETGLFTEQSIYQKGIIIVDTTKQPQEQQHRKQLQS